MPDDRPSQSDSALVRPEEDQNVGRALRGEGHHETIPPLMWPFLLRDLVRGKLGY
jgi:hypothetical protein